MLDNVFVEVKLWNKTVGYLHWLEEKGLAQFEYTDEFIQSGLDVAPVMMPLKKGVYEFPELVRSETFNGIPGLIADSLPDRFGNALIDAYLSKQNRDLSKVTPIERLLYMGIRGMGALEYQPALKKNLPQLEQLDFNHLVELAGDVLKKRAGMNANLDQKQGLEDIIQVGTSAGGARAKAVIGWNPKTNEVISGQVPLTKGFEHWLLKFDGVEDNYLATSQQYGRIEYAYYLMAIDCGIEMMACRLHEENNRAHFMTRRYDRPDESHKIHATTLCGIAHFDYNHAGAYSYEQAIDIARKINLTQFEIEQLYIRALFNILAQNNDDHTKNIGFVMATNGKWYLAPAYDISYAYRKDSRWVSQHQMTVNGKRQNFNQVDFKALADYAMVKNSRHKHIVKTIQSVLANWKGYAKQAGLDDNTANKIAGLISR